MIKARRKPLAEIYGSVKAYRRVLVVGCGGCTSVCLAGGQREARELADELAELARREGSPLRCEVLTVERQCNPEFLAAVPETSEAGDCALSLACGAGVQNLADARPARPVFPALDTLFIGVDVDVGLYEERCRQCGDCKLAYTGGICPVTRCAKSLLNGPCGGTKANGLCEVDNGQNCAWLDIHDRLKAQGRFESILEIRPPMEWTDRGPATLVQQGYETRYARRADGEKRE